MLGGSAAGAGETAVAEGPGSFTGDRTVARRGRRVETWYAVGPTATGKLSAKEEAGLPRSPWGRRRGEAPRSDGFMDTGRAACWIASDDSTGNPDCGAREVLPNSAVRLAFTSNSSQSKAGSLPREVSTDPCRSRDSGVVPERKAASCGGTVVCESCGLARRRRRWASSRGRDGPATGEVGEWLAGRRLGCEKNCSGTSPLSGVATREDSPGARGGAQEIGGSGGPGGGIEVADLPSHPRAARATIPHTDAAAVAERWQASTAARSVHVAREWTGGQGHAARRVADPGLLSEIPADGEDLWRADAVHACAYAIYGDLVTGHV
ncbi:hypothetical protein K466DRAFT_83718 [Polyporus arcularius HHB13444]|uniref:Uncharacterized protein n=1 Tax=Polyporus arcularius HHB13444 TaxID=1314778 RepID=A0A5C3PEP4_9APHY|nr:hypothetical protein K466DRAFT_83718 [Polyporus arcularius HHB13444]